MFDPHNHAVVGPGGHSTVWAELAADRKGVVAHDREALRDALEQARAVVLDPAEAPVHHHRRALHGPVEQVTEALVAEAHPEHRDVA